MTKNLKIHQFDVRITTDYDPDNMKILGEMLGKIAEMVRDFEELSISIIAAESTIEAFTEVIKKTPPSSD
jgi:hypothetical protein